MQNKMQEYFKSYRICHEDLPSPHTNGKRPKQNVIWFISDQHSANTISANGDPNVHTPNLDNMITEGVNFTNATSCFPICCPFRATMLTGIDHQSCMQGHEFTMPENVKTIADAFNENGYETAYFGKWHLKGNRDMPMQTIIEKEKRGGFKTWIGFENNNNQWNTWVHGHKDDGTEVPAYRLQGFETDELTDLIISYIEKRTDEKPFFAVISVQPPHKPLVAPPRNRKDYQWSDIKLRENVPHTQKEQDNAKQNLAAYYSMIENIDENIGRIKEKLCMTGLDLNTHIMYFSDHGDMMGSHGLYGKVVPYKESVNIPFIISSTPGQFYGYKTGKTNALITEHDIAATTLGLCDIKQPEWLSGYDYSHYRFIKDSDNLTRVTPKADEPKYAFIKSVVPREGCDKAWRGIVTRDGFKYVCMEGAEWLLFNLNEDPLEEINLVHSGEYREKRRDLLAVLKTYVEKAGNDFVLPEIL